MKKLFTRFALLFALVFSALPSLPASADVVVGFGDSITRGYPFRLEDLFGAREGGYIPTLEAALRQRDPKRNWEVHNWGFGRMNSMQATGKIGEALGISQPDWVLVMIGTNDLFDGISAASMKANIQFILDRVQATGAEPALATITPSYFPGQGGEAIPALLNPKILEIIDETGILLNDAYSFFLPNWPSLNTDGLHPNSLGYQLLAQTWCDTVPICSPQVGRKKALPFMQDLLLN